MRSHGRYERLRPGVAYRNCEVIDAQTGAAGR